MHVARIEMTRNTWALIFWSENQKIRELFEYFGLDGMIILK